VQKGILDITIDGSRHLLKTGEKIIVPPDTMHFGKMDRRKN
jgi:hypothetical protein